jgi:uncharacterized phage protein gp47/JayE
MVLIPSRLDLYERGRQYVLQKAKKIDAAMVDVEGSDVNLVVGSTSYMAQQVSRQSAQEMGEHFLDPSMPDEQLDRLVFDSFAGMTRKGAAPSYVTIEPTRPTAGAGAGTIPTNTSLLALSGTQFVTIAPSSFGASDLVGAPVIAKSVLAGIAYNVGKNQIRSFSDASSLFDPTIQINNPDRSAGGADRESNDLLVARAQQFFITARRGTLGAIEFGALAVPGVESAHAVEIITTGLMPARVVVLYIADGTGVSNAALGNIVRNALLEYRGGGVAVLVQTSVPELVSVQLLLTFAANVDTVTVTSNIRAAIVGFINSLGVNQPLLRNDLGGVLARFKSDGLIPNVSTIASPLGDIVPDPGQTLRVRLDDVTVI